MFQRDQRSPERAPAGEALRPVERVDDPARVSASGMCARFFAEESVRGKRCAHHVQDGGF
jgi:hypothetical protein